MYKSKKIGPFFFYKSISVFFGGSGQVRWGASFFGWDISYTRPF